MFLALELNQFDAYNIFTSEKTKNNIMHNSDFYRLYLSDENIVLNGIFLRFDLINVTIEKYFNKIKCCFDDSPNNLNNINNIIDIERQIIKKSTFINDKPCFRIDEQMSHKYIKIFDQHKLNHGKYKNLSILLKISGIWSSNIQTQYGLTFRFFINHSY